MDQESGCVKMDVQQGANGVKMDPLKNINGIMTRVKGKRFKEIFYGLIRDIQHKEVSKKKKDFGSQFITLLKVVQEGPSVQGLFSCLGPRVHDQCPKAKALLKWSKSSGMGFQTF